MTNSVAKTVSSNASNLELPKVTLRKLVTKQLGATLLFSTALHIGILYFAWDLGGEFQRAQELVSSIERERSPETHERRIVTIADIQSEGTNSSGKQPDDSAADKNTDDSEAAPAESPAAEASDTPEPQSQSPPPSPSKPKPESNTNPPKPPEPTELSDETQAVAAAGPQELEATTPPTEEEPQVQSDANLDSQTSESAEEPLANTSQAMVAESGEPNRDAPRGGTANAASAASDGPDGNASSSNAGGSGDGDTPPSLRAVSKTRVPYPRDAWANGWETTCRARLFIDTNGRVQRVEDIVCDAHTTVFAPALRAHILRWFRFTPAQRNGEPSRAVIRWEHDFRLSHTEVR